MIYSQQVGVTVIREDQDRLSVAVNSLATDREDWLQMSVSLPDLKIRSAYLETPQHEEGLTYRSELESLEGLEVYLDSVKEVKAAMAPYEQDQSGHYTRMALEAVIGVLQAETFFFEERGFTDSAAYERYWREMYRNQCRYYSNLDRVKRDFTHYVNRHRRVRHLFSRSSHLQVEQTVDNSYRGSAYLSDSFHEMSAWFEVDGSTLEVINTGGKVVRAPDDVCFEAGSLFNALPGKKMIPANKSTVRSIVGGAQGCAHFADMAAGFMRVLNILQQREQ